ncbi:MAG: HD domain-containing protein [Nitrospirota bacterium]|nr:HD domain-containing protein [Nitrospirota bacterium]
MTGKVLEMISLFMTALSNCTLYSKEHPSVYSLSERSAGILEELYNEDRFTIAVLGERLIVNDLPFAGKSVHMNGFMKKLRRKGIEKIVVSRGLTPEELKEFISEIALSDTIKGAYPHISSGVVEVNLKAAGYDFPAVMEENRGKVKELYQGVARFKPLDMAGLESVVMSFISTLKQETRVLRGVSPVKSHSEYTFAHATNVAVLSICQAESLGLKGEMLHDICLAGLLHDVGKMFIPKELLDKQAKLDENEWNEMKKHPVYGALYLSKLHDVPKLAVIATYEHHMRFDGTGYPDTKKRGKKQHIASQIIAISDFFDALRTERPYRRALEVPVICGLLTEASGKEFNPLLVENFLRSIRKNI